MFFMFFDFLFVGNPNSFFVYKVCHLSGDWNKPISFKETAALSPKLFGIAECSAQKMGKARIQ